MAKYVVIHPSKAVIQSDTRPVGVFRQGDEIDLTTSTKKRVKQLLDGGFVALPDSTEAKAAVKSAKTAREEAE